MDGSAELSSFHDADGVVTLGFAGNVVISGGEPLVKVTFKTTTCDALVGIIQSQENNDHISVTTEVDVGAHQWGTWTEITPATCIANGTKTRTCSLCGAVQTESLPVDGQYHSWSNWQTVKPSDGNTPAIIGRTCKHCNETQKQWAFGDSTASSDIPYYFNLLSIQKDFITSAKVSDAMINSIRQIVTTDGSLRYLVELSDKTAFDETISVRLESWESTASGFGSAIRKEKTENGVTWDDSELDYQIALENGIGKMTAYSYYNCTDYTELDIYFYIGEGGEAWMTPSYIELTDDGCADGFVSKLGIWGANPEKIYWLDKATDGKGNSYYTGYFWLSADTPDDAELDFELSCKNTPAIYDGHKISGEDVRLSGLTITLENGFATLKFTASSGSTAQYYTIYLRNEINMAPECNISESSARICLGDSYQLDLRTIFSDANGDILNYTVSINGADAVAAAEQFVWTARDAGVYTLVFTARDTSLLPASFTVTLTVLENYIPGDVNADGVVDMKDVTFLKRYLAGRDVEIQTSSADTNGDGQIDMKDVTLLRRYLAGWNVELQ